MSRKAGYLGGHTVYTSKDLSRGERLTPGERKTRALETKTESLEATRENVARGIASTLVRRRLLHMDRQAALKNMTAEERALSLERERESRLAMRKEAKAKKKAQRKAAMAKNNPPALSGRIIAKRDGVVTTLSYSVKKQGQSE